MENRFDKVTTMPDIVKDLVQELEEKDELLQLCELMLQVESQRYNIYTHKTIFGLLEKVKLHNEKWNR